MATTVHVTSISPSTTQDQVQDFFSFCGKINNLSLTPSANEQSATVTFEKPTAAKTALLLDNTQLGPNVVHVSAAATLEEMSAPKSSSAPGVAAGESEVEQEDKPRSRIVAEYLAHGYTISDKAIERAIALDQQHGVSSRFTNALADFDKKYKATEKAQGLDQKYGVSNKAYSAWGGLNSYFERAMGTPSGQRVRAFYMDGSKQVLDVHTEARRLADLKAGKAPAYPVPGTDKTTCQCGGDTGICSCTPGQCACASCPKNYSGGQQSASGVQSVPGTGMTTCNCGAELGKCPCEPGKCTCANCPKSHGGSDPTLYKQPTGNEASAYEKEKAQMEAVHGTK